MNKTLATCLSLAGMLLSCCFSSCMQKYSEKGIRFQQYYTEGEVLYGKHCSNCHQKSGEGLRLLYPPLNPSDYLDSNLSSVFCQMKYGIKGEMRVNGNLYNQPMPGVRSLTELEIAEIATFISNSWGHQHGKVELEEVRKALGGCEP